MSDYTVELSENQLTIALTALYGYIEFNRKFAYTFSIMSKTRKYILEDDIPKCEELIAHLENEIT